MAILKKAPEGANVLDLDAARAARAEARASAGEASQFIKISAGYIEVRPEIDLVAVDDINANRFAPALARILTDPEDVKPLLESGLTADDLKALVAFVTGRTLGE